MTTLPRVVALSALCIVILLDGGAGAADALPAGSWTQERQRLPVGDTPDVRADEGDDLGVESGPGGVVAFSAVQAPPGEGAVQGLTLTFSEPPTGTPVLWACVVKGSWKPGSRQVWQDRPDYDCASHSEGTVTEDAVTFDLATLGAPVEQVAIVPCEEEPAAFRALFEPPDATAFTLAPGEDEDAAPVLVDPPPAAPEEPAEAPAEEPVAEPAGEGVAPEVEVPGLAPADEPAAPAPDAPVVAEEEPAPVGAATDQAIERVTAAEPLLATNGVSRGGPALLAFLALLAMVRTALPVRAAGTPRSLLAPPEEPAPAPAAP